MLLAKTITCPIPNQKKKLPTWHEALLGYTGSAERRASAEAGMKELGKKANINFNFHVPAQWQPIESQRLLLWCGRYGRKKVQVIEIHY